MKKLLLLALLAPWMALATVTTTTTSVTYTCDGTTTAFPITFPFLDNSYLTVKIGASTGALGTDYTVTGAGTASGTLTLTATGLTKCPDTTALVITRATPATQPTSFRSQGSFRPATHENAYDRLTMALQEETYTRGTNDTVEQQARIAADDAINATVSNLVASNSGVTSDSYVTATGSTTPRTLAARAADVTNARDYGIDTAADAATALQDALDHAPSGGKVYVPAGAYAAHSGVTISKQIVIEMDPNATFTSDYAGALLTIAHSYVRLTGGSITLSGAGTWSPAGGGTGTAPAAITVYPGGTYTDLEIDHVYITGDGDATHGQQAIGNSSSCTLSDVHYHHNTVVGTTLGISVAGTLTGVEIASNYVSSITLIDDTTTGQGYGIHVQSTYGHDSGVKIHHNTLVRVQRHSIYVAMGNGIQATNNTIIEHRYGLTSNVRPAMNVARCQNVLIAENELIRPNGTGIGIGGDDDNSSYIAAHIILRGNIVRDWAYGAAIMVGRWSYPWLGDASDVLIDGNQFYSADSASPDTAITVNYGKRVTVANNIIAYPTATGQDAIYLVGLNSAAAPTPSDDDPTTYSDDQRIIGNTIVAPGAGNHAVRLGAGIVNGSGGFTTTARVEVIDNRTVVGGGAFYRAAAQGNVNIVTALQDTTGLDLTAMTNGLTITRPTVQGLLTVNPATQNTGISIDSTMQPAFHMRSGAAPADAKRWDFVAQDDGTYIGRLITDDGTSSNTWFKVGRTGSTFTYFALPLLPTASAGLPSGAIWNNSGVLNIVP